MGRTAKIIVSYKNGKEKYFKMENFTRLKFLEWQLENNDPEITDYDVYVGRGATSGFFPDDLRRNSG